MTHGRWWPWVSEFWGMLGIRYVLNLFLIRKWPQPHLATPGQTWAWPVPDLGQTDPGFRSENFWVHPPIDISSTSPYQRASSYLIVRAFISFGVVRVQTSPWFGVFYSWLRWLPDSIQWNRRGVSLDNAFKNRYEGTIPLDWSREQMRP